MAEKLKIEVWKDGKLAATADNNVKAVDIHHSGFPPGIAFWIPILDLERITVFEHLAGSPLSAFLDNAGVRIHYLNPENDEELDEDQLEPVFYVHGRSETARGNTTVSSVVLLWLDAPSEQLPPKRVLLSELPAIYKEVVDLL